MSPRYPGTAKQEESRSGFSIEHSYLATFVLVACWGRGGSEEVNWNRKRFLLLKLLAAGLGE